MIGAILAYQAGETNAKRNIPANLISLAQRFNDLSGKMEELEPKIDMAEVERAVSRLSSNERKYGALGMAMLCGGSLGGIYGAIALGDSILGVLAFNVAEWKPGIGVDIHYAVSS